MLVSSLCVYDWNIVDHCSALRLDSSMKLLRPHCVVASSEEERRGVILKRAFHSLISFFVVGWSLLFYLNLSENCICA